jgi:hypothetical protein
LQKAPPDLHKKARCVVDGSKRARRHAKVGHTFANSLASNGERIFWALAALLGLIVVGADVSNAFAEAPAPEDSIYVVPDEVFRDWWVNHKGRSPIPPGWVIPVNYAFQGHPEAPCLWEKHVDQIVRQEGLSPTHHEPCLYSGHYDGNYILFLRQVDDFAVGSNTTTLSDQIITNINRHLCIQIKNQGIITMFNGMDIIQSQYFIKIHCGTYLYKTLKNQGWLLDKDNYQKLMPLPFPADHTYAKLLDTTNGPDNEYAQKKFATRHETSLPPSCRTADMAHGEVSS